MQKHESALGPAPMRVQARPANGVHVRPIECLQAGHDVDSFRVWVGRRRPNAHGRMVGRATIQGMNFDLTQEQAAIRDVCRDFAREVVAPAAEKLDRNHEFGYDIVRQMGELGLFGLPFGEEVGGAGGDFLSLCLAIEEISRADAGVGITLEAAVCLGSSPIYEFGTREQKDRWLPDLVAGRKLWAFGLTEPEAGGDAGARTTRAEQRDGTWVINGAKQFITNSGTDISAGVTITAVTGRNGKEAELSALIVPTGTPGYHALESYGKLGWHSSDTHP